MITYISILRGINVSGKNMIKMDALKAMYIGMGFHNVTTYIQSGNVVFQSEQSDADAIGQLITDELSKKFELNVPVLIREYSEFKRILLSNPFIDGEGGDISKLHITFLSELPEDNKVQSILNGFYQPDEFYINGKSVYLSCPNGYGNTKLSNSFFENKLKVKATTRNLRTILELERIGGMIENGTY